MICPQCHKTVPADATVCPHCSAYLGSSAAASSREFIFCEGCGARLSAKDRTCPKCGRPAPGILSTEASATDLAAGRTASFPKLTDDAVRTRAAGPTAAEVLDVSLDPSATHVLTIPDAADEKPARAGEDPYHRKKHPVGKIAAALMVILLVGACAYVVVADPFGIMPGIYAEIERQAAEMFPSRQGTQEVEAPEEDSSDDASVPEVSDTTVLTGDAAYERLTALYDEVGAYQDPLSTVVDEYNGGFLLSDLSARQSASEGAYTLRDAVQATIDAIDEVKLEQDSPYAEDLDHIRQLATWMYNRVDVLCASWDISLAVPEGESVSSHRDEITQPLRDALNAQGQNEDLVQFEANYSAWRPTRE